MDENTSGAKDPEAGPGQEVTDARSESGMGQSDLDALFQADDQEHFRADPAGVAFVEALRGAAPGIPAAAGTAFPTAGAEEDQQFGFVPLADVPEEGKQPVGTTPPPLFLDENRLSLDEEGPVAAGRTPPPLFSAATSGGDPDEGGFEIPTIVPSGQPVEGGSEFNPDVDGGGGFDPDGGFEPLGDREDRGGRRAPSRRGHEERQPRGHEDLPFRPREERQPRRDRNRPEPTADGGVATGIPFWLNRGFLIVAACLVLAIGLVFGWSRHKEAASDDAKAKAQATEVAKAAKDEPAKKATEAAATKEDIEGAQVVDNRLHAKVYLDNHGELEVIGSRNVHWDRMVYKAIADGDGSEVNEAVEALMSAHGRAIGVSGLDPARANGLVSNTLDRVGNSLDRTAQSMEQLVKVTKDVADANQANAKANQANADVNAKNSEKLDEIVGVLREGFYGMGVKMTPPKE
ncbi:MAG: hypothetical protein WC675_03380 [Patescibacteria group bacterium]|jgi:hypothetical protein